MEPGAWAVIEEMGGMGGMALGHSQHWERVHRVAMGTAWINSSWSGNGHSMKDS